MIASFRNQGTRDIFFQVDSKSARKVCPSLIWSVARRKLYLIEAVGQLQDLAVPTGNELHKLVRDRWGQHAIRINHQYRVCFRWTDEGAEDVEITDYH